MGLLGDTLGWVGSKVDSVLGSGNAFESGGEFLGGLHDTINPLTGSTNLPGGSTDTSFLNVGAVADEVKDGYSSFEDGVNSILDTANEPFSSEGVGSKTAIEDLDYRNDTNIPFANLDREYLNNFLSPDGDGLKNINPWELLGLGGQNLSRSVNSGVGQSVAGQPSRNASLLSTGVQAATSIYNVRGQQAAGVYSSALSAGISSGLSPEQAINGATSARQSFSEDTAPDPSNFQDAEDYVRQKQMITLDKLANEGKAIELQSFGQKVINESLGKLNHAKIFNLYGNTKSATYGLAGSIFGTKSNFDKYNMASGGNLLKHLTSKVLQIFSSKKEKPPKASKSNIHGRAFSHRVRSSSNPSGILK